MRRFFVALRALVYMTGFVLFWGWIALSAREFDPSFGVLLPAWTETLGIIFMPVGGLLALTCAAVFIARGRGTPAPFDPPEEFVAAGPYKYVRNPMYIGALVLLIGFGLCLHSISILLLSLVVFLLVDLFVVYFEEPNLSRKFGATYEAFCKPVPRWIPKWQPWGR